MKYSLHLLLCVGAVAGLRAELPIPVPSDELPPTNQPPGIVVPQPKGGGSGTNAAPAAGEQAPAPRPVPNVDSGIRYWKTVPLASVTLDSIRLRNEDSLAGRALGWEAGTVRWEHAAAARPIRFPGAGIAFLRLAPPTNAPASAATGWLVRLTNGNLLTGDGLTMNADTVELATSATGRLRLPRPMVEAVQRNSVQGLANFRALHWLGDWDHGTFGQYEQQRLVYRDVGLPDCVAVELLVPAPMAPGRSVALFLFCGDPSRLNVDPSHMVSLANNQLTIQTKGDNIGGASQLPLLPAKGRATVTLGILANRLTGRVVLLVDGEVKQTVQLAPLPERSGRGILVADNLPDEPVPFWVLLTPLAEDLQLAVAKADTDAVQFANGEVMEGRLESVGATNLVLSGKHGRVELPAERFLAARLAAAQRTEPRRHEGDVTVTMRDGNRLTAALQELGAEKLVLENELLGKIELARSLVAEIQAGLYEPPKKRVSTVPWEAGTIDLDGGPRLHGALAGFADGIVSWKHPQAIEPIEFRQGQVNRVTVLDSAADALPAAATVKLTNCDRLSGELVAVDGRTVRLRPSYMPALSVPRAMVTAVRPNATPDGVFDVAGSPTWSGSGKTPQITVTNNTVLFQPGACGQLFLREAPLPSRLCLQFDLVDQFHTRNLIVNVFGRPQGRDRQERCGVHLLANAVYLGAFNAFGAIPSSTNVTGYYRDDQGRRSITATVLIDREQRDMFVFIEGRLLAKWRGADALPAGNQLSFNVQSGSPTQLRRLMLSEWRGRIESLTNAVPPTVDSLLLHDMTRVTGTLTAVLDGQVYLAGQEGTATHGLGRINEIEFAKSNQEHQRQLAGDIRVHLLGGDRLTLSEARWDNTVLLGTSGAIGPVAVPGPAIARIEFRPYDPPPKTGTFKYNLYGGKRQISLD